MVELQLLKNELIESLQIKTLDTNHQIKMLQIALLEILLKLQDTVIKDKVKNLNLFLE